MDFELNITFDKMEASLKIAKLEDGDVLNEEKIKSFIKSQGISHGVKNTAIKDIIEAYNLKNQFIEKVIASGLKVIPTKQPKYKMNKVPLEDSEVIAKMNKEKEEDKLDRDYIEDNYPKLTLLRRGEIVGLIGQPQSGKPGIDIYGNEIEPEEEMEIEDVFEQHFDETLCLNNTNIECVSDGILCYEYGRYSLIALPESPTIEVKIADDHLSATLSLFPAMDGNSKLKSREVYNEINKHKVIYELKKGIIDSAIKKFTETGNTVHNVLISEGKPVTNGVDGSVKFLVDLENKALPKISNSGDVNFKDVSFFTKVKPNTPLAKLIKPTLGVDGIDVHNNAIHSVDGKAAVLPIGANTQASKEESGVLVSTIEGIVSKDKGLIRVDELMVVPHNVDYETGNIEYEGSVLIHGDVKEGFEVKAGGNVDIEGCLEDCTLIANGNVFVKQGFTGHHKGQVQCAGSFASSYIHNQTVKAMGEIVISKELYDSQIYSHTTVTAGGNPHSISGGHISALIGISANVVGNESGTLTKLEVGKNKLIEDKIKLNHENNQKVKKKIEFLAENIKHLENDLNFYKKLPEHQIKLLNRTQRAKEFLERRLAENTDNINKMQASIYYDDNCEITVRKVYPNTVIIIKDIVLRIDEIMERKTFRLVDGLIGY